MGGMWEAYSHIPARSGRNSLQGLFCLFVVSFLFLDCLIMLLCGVRPRGENIMFLFGGFCGGCYRQEDIIAGQD